MKQPSLDLLMKKVDSKYTLVVVVAKRARSIMEEGRHDGLNKGMKPVSISLEEVSLSDITYQCNLEAYKGC